MGTFSLTYITATFWRPKDFKKFISVRAFASTSKPATTVDLFWPCFINASSTYEQKNFWISKRKKSLCFHAGQFLNLGIFSEGLKYQNKLNYDMGRNKKVAKYALRKLLPQKHIFDLSRLIGSFYWYGRGTKSFRVLALGTLTPRV